MPITEAALVQGLLARDDRTMALFYSRYRAALYAAVLRIVRNRQTAEDVLQESLVKVWFAIASYDETQSRLFTWAAKICCNTAIDHVRSARFRLATRTAGLEDSATLQYAAAPGFQPEHVGVADLLLGLRPCYRQVMELLYLRGYTQTETAEELGVPLGTIKTWVSRARYLLALQPL